MFGSFCFLKIRIGGDNINGNYFLLPNSIFNEDMKPRDFAVYSFLVSRKDSVDECWYSVEHIAEYCNISVNTARRALHWLEENGYIEIKNLFLAENDKRIYIRFIKSPSCLLQSGFKLI